VQVDYDDDCGWIVVHRGRFRVVANIAAAAQVVPVDASEVVMATGEVEVHADGLRVDAHTAMIARAALPTL
jgi:maltooligosyltrehalose trehalohydrolase